MTSMISSSWPGGLRVTKFGRGVAGFGKLGALFAVAAALGACSQVQTDRTSASLYRLMGSERNPGIETLENTVQYSVVPPTRAMVNAPNALLVFERNLGGAVEQRVVLPNPTAVRGDNVIHIRAQTSDSARLGQFSFNEVEERFGGLPAPFGRINEGGLSSGSDSMGRYVYARENVGTSAVCVLVLRRIGIGARPLPRGTQALDVVMRNCVNGTVEQALAPMSANVLGVLGSTVGGARSLSPHAAPQG